jgi:hypothetical protein
MGMSLHVNLCILFLDQGSLRSGTSMSGCTKPVARRVSPGMVPGVYNVEFLSSPIERTIKCALSHLFGAALEAKSVPLFLSDTLTLVAPS